MIHKNVILPDSKTPVINNLRSGISDPIEAGDMGRSMGPEYMRNLEDMRASHSRLKGIYYIFAYQFQQAHTPQAQYVTFCSMREKDKPKPTPGGELWKVNNEKDTIELVWTLPHNESWHQLEKDIHTHPKLREYMQKYKEGTLDG